MTTKSHNNFSSTSTLYPGASEEQKNSVGVHLEKQNTNFEDVGFLNIKENKPGSFAPVSSSNLWVVFVFVYVVYFG